MSKKLKIWRFARFAGDDITLGVVCQKSCQMLTLRGMTDEHFVFHPFFCKTNLDFGTIPHFEIGMTWEHLILRLAPSGSKMVG